MWAPTTDQNLRDTAVFFLPLRETGEGKRGREQAQVVRAHCPERKQQPGPATAGHSLSFSHSKPATLGHSLIGPLLAYAKVFLHPSPLGSAIYPGVSQGIILFY